MKISRVKNRLNDYKSKVAKSGEDWRKFARASHYLSLSPARRPSPGGNPWADSKRWIENCDNIGLRFVGFSDELIRLNHKGWFTDQYCSDTYRGAVWRLPSRQGVPVFVYGYVDPYNENSAFIDFRHVCTEESAATMADDMAEDAAKESREFYAKDAAEQDILIAREAIHELNQSVMALINEIKEQGRKFSPAICEALTDQVRGKLKERKRLFALIAERRNDFWSSVEGF